MVYKRFCGIIKAKVGDLYIWHSGNNISVIIKVIEDTNQFYLNSSKPLYIFRVVLSNDWRLSIGEDNLWILDYLKKL